MVDTPVNIHVQFRYGTPSAVCVTGNFTEVRWGVLYREGTTFVEVGFFLVPCGSDDIIVL